MQKITPCLWYNATAKEAVEFYSGVFENVVVKHTSHYNEPMAKASGMPINSEMMIVFEIEGFELMALNGGPMYKFTPATFLRVNCKTEAEIDSLYKKLSDGGMVLMELAKYDFSDKFAWVNDRFGLSWQLNLMERASRIAPCLMFVGERHGKAEEAMRFYMSQFDNSEIVNLVHYGANEHDPEGTVKFAVFTLDGIKFGAMDSGFNHQFSFTPAMSFMINCDNQQEIDKYWSAMVAGGGKHSHCGWLDDRFGVSWQVCPTYIFKQLDKNDEARNERMMKAMLTMEKLDVAELERAYNSEPARK